MTKLRLLRTVAAIAACLALALPASAYDFVKDGIYYNVSGTNAMVTYKNENYNSYSGTVIIPSTVTNNGTTYNVVQINPSAFKNCTNLRRVVIPPSVKYLMNYAFQNCTGLTNITLTSTFYGCYNYVFDGCTNLKTIVCLLTTPRNWNLNNFPETVYSNATLVVPQGCKSAYQSVGGCLSNFSNIEEMDCDFAEDAIFYDILDDNQVEVTHALRFAEDYSGDIDIPSTVTHNGATYTVTGIGIEAFFSNPKLYSINVPATVNTIKNYAFYGCNYLTSVNIPEGVTDINYCVFGSCYSLPSIIIPSTVTWIAQNAFSYCSSLTSITCKATTPPMCVDSSSFPSTAYNNATLKVPATSLSSYQTASVWSNFYNIVGQDYDFVDNGIYYNITGPNTAEVTYKNKDYNSYSGSVNIPSTVIHDGVTYTVTAIGMSAFRLCTNLTAVSIPSTVTSIGYASFYKCSALTSMTLPQGVKIIDDHSLRESGLTQITIPNTVTSIGTHAFYGCNSLTTISIPNSVTSLGTLCFQKCSNLTSVTLGTGLTAIPNQCFTFCESLSSITIPSTVKTIGNFAFYNTGFTTFAVPEGVDSIGSSAFGYCQELTSISFPASVQSIGVTVLEDCAALAEITVDNANAYYRAENNVLYDKQMTRLIRYAPQKPDIFVSAALNVTSIEMGAFQNAANAQYILIGSDVSSIGYYAFSYCSALQSIYVNDDNPYYLSDNGVLYSHVNGIPQTLIKYPEARPDKHYSVLNGVDTISDGAFESSLLESVYIPQNVKELGYSTFSNSNVKRVVIDEGLQEIQYSAFSQCENLQSVYLPSSITTIREQAFLYDYNLANITFAGTVPPTIEANAFFAAGYDVGEPVTIYVPSTASSAYGSLDWNSNYFSFTVNETSPLAIGTEFTVDSLIYLTTDASLNTNVTGVTSKNIVDPGIPPKVAYQGNLCTVTMLGDHSLAYCIKMVRADVPFTVQRIDNYGAYGSTKLEQLTLREGLKEIGGFAFSHINNLTKVGIPASVDSIRGDAFTYDPMLYQIYVANGNTKYTSVDGILFTKDKKRLVAFADGHGEEYTVPIGTQIIDVEAFRGASALTAVNLPIGLKRIDRLAFMDCSALTALEMPSTLTSLGYSAFSNAPLTTLTVKAKTPPTCEIRIEPHSGTVSEPFNDTHYNNCTLIVPRGSKSAYQNAAVWKKFTNIVEADLPADYIRGDINNDGVVGMDDLTAMINYLVTNNTSNFNMDAADTNQDGVVGMDDLTVLINYLVYNTWPAPAPIDMWYLWGNFIGENPWGDTSGNSPIGVSALPLYPTGTFNAQGKGTLTWTGYIPRQYFTIVHSAGYYDDLASEVWMVDQNGNYLVTSIDEGDNNGYSAFLLEPDYYTITLNTATMSLSIEPYAGDVDAINSFGSITMPGNYNYWSTTANPMDIVNTQLRLDNHDWFVDEFTITSDAGMDGDVKFSTYDSWDYNWGSAEFPYGTGVNGGMNIPVKVGTYKVFFNDITGQYNFIKME